MPHGFSFSLSTEASDNWEVPSVYAVYGKGSWHAEGGSYQSQCPRCPVMALGTSSQKARMQWFFMWGRKHRKPINYTYYVHNHIIYILYTYYIHIIYIVYHSMIILLFLSLFRLCHLSRDYALFARAIAMSFPCVTGTLHRRDRSGRQSLAHSLADGDAVLVEFSGSLEYMSIFIYIYIML